MSNIKGDRDKASDIILNNELLLMQQLNYNLTVHNPFRPVEGLLIDIKVFFKLKIQIQFIEINYFLNYNNSLLILIFFRHVIQE